jgi:DNA mismatch endonuclease (patch repair protein)
VAVNVLQNMGLDMENVSMEVEKKVGSGPKKKIEGNRRRDRKNFRRLRRLGWQVIRIWEHDVKCDAESCVDRVERLVRTRANGFANGRQ